MNLGIKESAVFNLINEANAFGNVITAATIEKSAFEPLPYSDYSAFQENYDQKYLQININPHAITKYVFPPHVSVKVQVTSEKKHSSNAFSSNLYTIRLTLHNYNWEVVRTYKELKELHKNLAKIVKQDLGRSCSDIPRDEIKTEWPLFPIIHDHFIPSDEMELACIQIASYIEKILLYPPFRDHPLTLKLVGVSPLSFIHESGPSLIECTLLKRKSNTSMYCESLKLQYTKRWFVLKDTYLVSLNTSRNNLVGFAMLIDTAFTISKRTRLRAYHGLEIKNLQHKIFLKFKSNFEQNKWYDILEYCIKNSGKHFNDKSLLPNGSYAPIRRKQLCKWYINAAMYMEHVMHALNNAKEEIYITDWWLSPELFLKRPTEDLQYRLDKILLKKSREGVKIYIMLFKEIKFTVELYSSRAKSILTQNGTNPNIKVLRHPEHSPSGVFLWSHHEKMVVIDQSVAFLGGIDLCYGRWDDDLHRLVDLGRRVNRTISDPLENQSVLTTNSIDQVPNPIFSKMDSIVEEVPLRESRNERKKNGPVYQKIDSTRYSDSMIVAALMGVTNSMARSYASPAFLSDTPVPSVYQKETLKTKRSISCSPSYNKESNEIKYIRPDHVETNQNTFNDVRNSQNNPQLKNKWREFKKTLTRRTKNLNTFTRTKRRQSDSSSADSKSNCTDSGGDEDQVEPPVISNDGYYWYGKDYCNTYKSDFKAVFEFWLDQLDRTETPRMPWRDQGLVVIGESARDLARHFIQRWNQCKKEKARNIDAYPFLLPKSYPDTFKYNHEWFKDTFYKCEVQMIRSLDKWSGGIAETECSILNSYIDLIQRAEHYIYIENQFFITTTDSSLDNEVKNMIGAELVKRIHKAYVENQKFRVYVVLPLLPAFDSPNAIQAVQYFNLRSIINGDFSIFKKLESLGVTNPSEYITFHGMRNWAELMGKLVNEIIYVHSKLMIVDDKYVICGSANINDRSMLGKRDSEIAAVVKDEDLFESTFDKQRVMVGKYANSLRKKIFKLHLGIYFNNPKKIDVQDCVSDEFYQYFRSVSKQNTDVYDQVFKCLPSDNITDFQILSTYSESTCLSKTDPIRGKKELEKVNGFIVDFPLKFLSKESYFFPDIGTPEGIVPIATWT